MIIKVCFLNLTLRFKSVIYDIAVYIIEILENNILPKYFYKEKCMFLKSVTKTSSAMTISRNDNIDYTY